MAGAVLENMLPVWRSSWGISIMDNVARMRQNLTLDERLLSSGIIIGVYRIVESPKGTSADPKLVGAYIEEGYWHRRYSTAGFVPSNRELENAYDCLSSPAQDSLRDMKGRIIDICTTQTGADDFPLSWS